MDLTISNKKEFQVTGNGLKLIAIITMLIDHVAYGLYNDLSYIYGWDYTVFGMSAYDFMRLVGRMAFPIYCFLLIEGFYHTRNFTKYAFRLFILAIISEFPFDYGINFYPSYWDYNNVVFTLLIGLLTVKAIDYVKHSNNKYLMDGYMRSLACGVIFVAGCGLAYLLKTDYDFAGVATIVEMYYLYGESRSQRLASFAGGVLILALGCSYSELAALFMLIPVYFYQGNRGSSSRIMRYAFNYFYPVHLLAIGLVAHYVFRL